MLTVVEASREPKDTEALAQRLRAVDSAIAQFTIDRLALPGGIGDALLRDRVEELNGERATLREALGLPNDR